MNTRLFRCTIQDEPFGKRWYLSGRQPTLMKTGPLETATHYGPDEIGLAVRRCRDIFGPSVIITVL